MKRINAKSHNSGQALIVASLVISVMLLSTAYYVNDTEKNIRTSQIAADLSFLTTKSSIANTLISALANITNGGNTGILGMDLDGLSSTIENHSYDERFDLQFTPLNSSPYQNGIYISWGSNGTGVSSASVSFFINFSGPYANSYSEYEANVTTAIAIESTITSGGPEKNVNVTCQMLNGKDPAQASDITLYYQNETGGPWTTVLPSDNLNSIDYGNGTYFISFTAYAQNTLHVSAQAHDLRNILVMANATSVEV
jgi:hypothetical protein